MIQKDWSRFILTIGRIKKSRAKVKTLESFQPHSQTIMAMYAFSVEAIILRKKVNTFFLVRISKKDYIKYTVKT